MDPKLAEVYKTNDVDEADVEALATAALAEKLASADEINVDGMSDEEAEALASQIIDGDAEAQAEGEGEPEAEQPAEGEEKTAGEEGEQLTPEQEKIAEADYLGRVMAHAYVAERKEIEKEAAAKSKTAGKLDNLKGGAAMAGAAMSKHKDKAVGAAKAGAGKVMEHVKAHGKHMAGAAAAAGAAGVAAGRKSKKASAEQPAEEEQQLSALDQLAVARAHEILKEHGIDPNAEQQETEETEKKSSINEEQAALLAQKVDERALAMIANAGYELPAKEEEAPAEEAAK